MNVSDLVQGKTYKVKRTQDAYFGRTEKVAWYDGVYTGEEIGRYVFDLGGGREVLLPADSVKKKVKEL